MASGAWREFDMPKVIVAIQHADGTVTALAGVAWDVEITMEREEYETPWVSPFRRYNYGAPQYEAHIRFRGAVQYQHMAGFDDIPDPQAPPAELENRREIEAPRKELEG